MTIKERKQITGTTEQIQAYAGHEGQIVWDKEKKTFVGMSGTAGTNYPLAQKEYVDNEVAKCLPLSGGKLTGGLTVNGSVADSKVAGIYTDDQTSELMIVAGDVDWEKGGGALALYGKSHPIKGGFNLLGVDADGKPHMLSANPPSGWKLKWEGKEVEVVTAKKGLSYIRYESGLQLVFGWVTVPQGGTRVNFEVPFANEHTSLQLTAFNGFVLMVAQIVTTTYAQIVALAPTGGYKESGGHFFAIGMWK